MKKTIGMVLMCLILSGCAGNQEATMPSTQGTQAPTTAPTTVPTEATEPPVQEASETVALLQSIWDAMPEGNRFAAYGGTVEQATEDAPGPLVLENTEELTTKYLIPADRLAELAEGASLVHLMNSNIFTGAAFRLTEGADLNSFAKALRDNLQQTQWVCGQPDRLLVAQAEGQVLMAFGEQELMIAVQEALITACPDASILYNEAVTE